MPSARIAALVTGVALAFPSAALAQTSSGGVSPDTAGPGNAAPLTGSAPSGGSATSGGSAKSSAAPTPTASTRRLPTTGADAGLIALTGTGLLLTGAGLRLRLGESSPQPE
jgi:hypothetical protein